MKVARGAGSGWLVATAAACLLLPGFVLGHAGDIRAEEDHFHADTDDDRDRIRESVEKGEIKSLADLRRIVLARVNGKIVSTEIDRKGKSLIYEFRVLSTEGRLVEVEVDAASGLIREIENQE
ncbi:PepSY domain-containing protein [Rhizobium sp. S95]|uniref:PepSY domain-containing protein n=1 Tax=Ciceribacter sichuanensis TaxID=2949647 RepID=A0AAJ1BXV7_9HYPH|nr:MULTISPECIES: PepSY domain-containing protein [unclassified Ciceribacter]MCM2398761.1 PepSY domain-containing protein [Ciceribacter sp. S95]MCM2403640.1 PepSY domain-containing protein [Ciceribacter sp. S153]MCO5957033.1 PepSY domain-containing protein [Ciceribacter sp. S101]